MKLEYAYDLLTRVITLAGKIFLQTLCFWRKQMGFAAFLKEKFKLEIQDVALARLMGKTKLVLYLKNVQEVVIQVDATWVEWLRSIFKKNFVEVNDPPVDDELKNEFDKWRLQQKANEPPAVTG